MLYDFSVAFMRLRSDLFAHGGNPRCEPLHSAGATAEPARFRPRASLA